MMRLKLGPALTVGGLMLAASCAPPVGSDDPAFFASSLVEERARSSSWGIDVDELNRNAATASFLGAREKAPLVARLDSAADGGGA